MKEIILGGGCFWCVEAVFQRVSGVKEIIAGYSGGNEVDPTYKEICSGKTKHVEVIKIRFDESVVGLSTILDIFMLTHEPTNLDKQGYDEGYQYKSVIFYFDDQDLIVINKIIEKYNKEFAPKTVKTMVQKVKNFYKAEEYHQDYYNKNSQESYCRIVIRPKIDKLNKIIMGLQNKN